MNETKPKKMVSRNVAIAVGIICIVLVASLAGAIAYYTSVVSGKDNKISSLESQLSLRSARVSPRCCTSQSPFRGQSLFVFLP